MVPLIALAVAGVLCLISFLFALPVLLTSRRPYLVSVAMGAAFVAGASIAVTYGGLSRTQPSVVELVDALIKCEQRLQLPCHIAWRATARLEDVPITIEDAEIASTHTY